MGKSGRTKNDMKRALQVYNGYSAELQRLLGKAPTPKDLWALVRDGHADPEVMKAALGAALAWAIIVALRSKS